MPQSSCSQIDQWLSSGGWVVAASDRAARALRASFHRRRGDEGLEAWPAPALQDWNSFLRSVWESRCASGSLLLNPLQELALWNDLAAASSLPATLLDGPRHRLAELSAQAHALLCTHSPRTLAAAQRRGWSGEPAVFSEWLEGFDALCLQQKLLSPARLALEVTDALKHSRQPNPPLLLVGFDRILPAQNALLEAWGEWQLLPNGPTASEIHFYAAPDQASELAACALGCAAQLRENPAARLLVIAQNAKLFRGELERALLLQAAPARQAGQPIFEFSLGQPLSQVELVRSALLTLKWLEAPLTEQELDWLLASGRCAASPAETLALLAHQRLLRRRGLERTVWTLESWAAAHPATVPTAWMERMRQTRTQLEALLPNALSPLTWAEETPRLLQTAAWPGPQPLASAEFQALERWHAALESVASLGFDGRRLAWTNFLEQLERTLQATLFTVESEEAPIQIVGPAESAGLSADAIWFLGADEDSWPPSGSTHPLLPLALQRETGMPFADPRLDSELASNMLTRIASSASRIAFSYTLQKDNAEARPARGLVELAGTPASLPAGLRLASAPAPATLPVTESEPIPLPPSPVAGGSSVLTAQSLCPFRAFASARLNAQGWEPAQPCLTAAQRGQLLHDALHSIWSGRPGGLRTHADLMAVADLPEFVRPHVRAAMQQTPAGVRDLAPPRYLELEEERLCALLAAWLHYESARLPFTVEATELARPVTLAGLTLKLRLDRLDRLNDGTVLVIDYKTGIANPSSWELPRPDDVQLPLYAGFGLDTETQPVGGLALARISATERAFAGRIADARATLLPELSGQTGLVRNPLTLEDLIDWRDCIEQLAKDFLEGEAAVDPKPPQKVCLRCDLDSLCRIREKLDAPLPTDELDEDDDE